MTFEDYISLLPFFVLLAGSLIVLLLESFFSHSSKTASFWMTVASIAGAALILFQVPAATSPLLTPWIQQDPFYKSASLIALGTGFLTLLMSILFFRQFKKGRGEFDFFLLMALMGLLFIASAADFLTLFLGLETLSLALYTLVGYMKQWRMSSEASIKYLLLGALGTALLLYGIALLYGALGTTSLTGLENRYASLTGIESLSFFWGGIVFITCGLLFKAAAVPFQFWAPDVYEGASTPVTAFMSVGVKAGAFFAFARVFAFGFQGLHPFFSEAIGTIAVITLLISNLIALRQLNLRRLFAYSGISHTGFLLIAVAIPGQQAIPALLFYLVIYAVATLGAFFVICLLDKDESGVYIHDLKGLSSRQPLLALLFAFSVLTLLGFPPTAGFFAKFFLFKSAIEAGLLWVVIAALLSTVISAFYYLRLIATAYTPLQEKEEPAKPLHWASLGALCFCVVLLIISLFPSIAML